MKVITTRQFASIKRTAMNVNPLVTKKNKAVAKIQELQNEVEALEAEITGYEGGILAMTGYKSEELVTKVVTKTDKVDKDGKPLTKTEYIPTNLLTFNEEKNVYELQEPTDIKEWFVQAPNSKYGSDYDVDSEKLTEASND